MIDIHCHIIPGVDDGSPDQRTTERMLLIAAEQGTRTIIATPHYYRGYFENRYTDIKSSVSDLNIFAKELNINIEILPGQEILLDNYSLQLYKQGIISGLNSTHYMLAEFPMDKLPKQAFDIIYEFRLLGIKLIISHPERYVYIINQPGVINSFIDEGCLFQLNSGSLTGIFGREVKDTARILLEHGIYSFIASDAHTGRGRNPGLKEAFERAAMIDESIAETVNTNCEMMLMDKEIITSFEKIKEKKSIFEFLKRKF